MWNSSLEENAKMMSFDVVSLYTRVPIHVPWMTITYISSNMNLEDYIKIPAADICCLTAICWKSIYLQFHKSFFEQVDRAAMPPHYGHQPIHGGLQMVYH